MAHNGGSTGGGGYPPHGFAFMEAVTSRVPGDPARLNYMNDTRNHNFLKDYNLQQQQQPQHPPPPLPQQLHSRYPTGTIASPNFGALAPADVQQHHQQQQQQSVVRDYRNFHIDREKRNNESIKSTDQAVQKHFEESLRLASQKKLWQQQPGKYEDEPISRSALPPGGPVSAIGLDKPFYGPPTSFDPAKTAVDTKVSLYPKVSPVLPRQREIPFPVHRREPERVPLPPPGNNHIKSSVGYFPPSVSRPKVNSPAPPQFYGKPDARVGNPSNVPSARHYDPSEIAPLSLTSKNTTVARNSPPVTSASSLPQHEVRSAELTNYYMHSSGTGSYAGGSAPQLQPLDLGGKRKSESEAAPPPNLEPKKIKNEDDMPLDLKASRRTMSPLANYSTSDSKPFKAEKPSMHSSSLNGAEPSLTSQSAVSDTKPTSLHLPGASAPQSGPFNFSRDGSSSLEADVAHLSKTPPISSQSGVSRGTASPSVAPTQAESVPVVSNAEAPSANPQEQTVPSGISSSTTAPKKNWLEKYTGEDGVNIETNNKTQGRASTAVSGFLKGGNESSPDVPSKNGQISHNSSAKNGSTNRKSGGNKSRKRYEGGETNSSASVNTNSSRTNPVSSDSEDDNGRASSRRVPPKGKKRNGRRSKKKATAEESVDSEKVGSDSGESNSKGKDSPSYPTTPPDYNSAERRPSGRPRGRATSPKYDRKNPFNKPPVKQLKLTHEPYLQDKACPVSPKCRECLAVTGSKGNNQHPFCRHYAFRKLFYNKKGALEFAGFSDPMTDATEEDKNLWLPTEESLPECLEFSMSKRLIEHLGDQFCALVKEENEAAQFSNGKPVWKRVIKGVRDLCDVCNTTLFNYHWTCDKCGFVVCIACYKSRRNGIAKVVNSTSEDRDKYQWLLCMVQKGKTVETCEHDFNNLMLTQVIAGDALNELNKLVHAMRKKYGIPQLCGCGETKNSETDGENQQISSNGVTKGIKQNDDSSSSDDEEHSALRNHVSVRGKQACDEKDEVNGKDCEDNNSQPIVSANSSSIDSQGPNKDSEFHQRSNLSNYHRQLLPIRTSTLLHSRNLYPKLPHAWLCAGRLLKLEDPTHQGNLELFQDLWKRGQPVLVANVADRLTKDLWTPQSFARDPRLQEEKSDLVNCISGKTLHNQPIRKFWEGFDNVEKRIKDEDGNHMLLKLKDWPPTEDFAVLLPDRFKDLMKALPLTDYTDRYGRLNLAARLPDKFVRPDLGPKMYIAYGSGHDLEKGTTNLHLDISDAVNVMVHVGVPEGIDNRRHLEEVRKAIIESDCDEITIKEVLEDVTKAGALWHIYNSRDAAKVRDLLHKVAKERKIPLEQNYDPIHDQNWYLDRDLRNRLRNEYDVCGYPIIQRMGDAVFIPAGAPHQVRNLNNCIKIAEDFVSPENVSHCFDLTEEFRRLSDTHQNHEDKLQIKNIMYHAVKDAISVLMYSGPGGPSADS